MGLQNGCRWEAALLDLVGSPPTGAGIQIWFGGQFVLLDWNMDGALAGSGLAGAGTRIGEWYQPCPLSFAKPRSELYKTKGNHFFFKSHDKPKTGCVERTQDRSEFLAGSTVYF